jgi:flavin-binding protein dodecin
LGLPVTTVARTIADVANSGLSQELVEQAIAEALQRGLTTVHDLRQTTSRRKGRAASIVAQVLQTRSQP